MSNELKNEINIDIEEYIKDLSPELQEKARACKSYSELTDLAAENKIPLPDEALECVAGGKLNDKGLTFPGWYRLNKDIADVQSHPWACKGNKVYVLNKGSFLVAVVNNDWNVYSWKMYGIKLYNTDALEPCE